MDGMSSPPLKKLRASSSINIPTIECKRQFSLPYKFPSTVSPKYNFMLRNDGMITITNTNKGGNLNESGSRTMMPINTTKTLRLRASDGRDLGEVKVQLLPKNNAANTQKISYHVLPAASKGNKLTCFASSPPMEINGAFDKLSSFNDRHAAPQLFLKSITPKDLQMAGNSRQLEAKANIKNVLQKHCTIAEINKAERSHIFVVLNQDRHASASNTQSNAAMEKLKQNRLVLVNKKKNINELLMKKKQDPNLSGKKVVLDGTMRKPRMQADINALKPKRLNSVYQKLVTSKYPIVRCEKLVIPKAANNASGSNPTFVRATKKVNVDTRIANSSTNVNSISNRNLYRKESKESVVESKSISPGIKDSMEKKADYAHNESNNVRTMCNIEVPNMLTEDNTVASRNDKDVHNENRCAVNNVTTKPPTQINDKTCLDEKGSNKGANTAENIAVNKVAQEAMGNTTEKKLSDCLDVIKEALISVKDEELRARALKALADCGIGIAKSVPIIPPEQLKVVHDSQMQTEVFGLLDAQNFVLVKEAVPTLERIKQVERTTMNIATANAETQTKPIEKPIQSRTVTRNPIDGSNVLPMCNSVPLDVTFDLDSYFQEYFSDNTVVQKVQETLSTSHSRYKKVAALLESDYNGLQRYDLNGMLNIHRAVANDQLKEVQRLLLVLQASKVDIDVLTEDGMSSLELAIQCNASTSIVRLLLEAGAKPVPSELLHESAVILASKLTSPNLPHLLEYVPQSELLDRVDSLGSAPLHYCALNGNVDGVMALLKSGADVNLRDNRSGRTAFFHALENNHQAVACKLLEHGAIADLVNFSGQSVMSLIDETKCISLKVALKRTIN